MDSSGECERETSVSWKPTEGRLFQSNGTYLMEEHVAQIVSQSKDDIVPNTEKRVKTW